MSTSYLSGDYLPIYFLLATVIFSLLGPTRHKEGSKKSALKHITLIGWLTLLVAIGAAYISFDKTAELKEKAQQRTDSAMGSLFFQAHRLVFELASRLVSDEVPSNFIVTMLNDRKEGLNLVLEDSGYISNETIVDTRSAIQRISSWKHAFEIGEVDKVYIAKIYRLSKEYMESVCKSWSKGNNPGCDIAYGKGTMRYKEKCKKDINEQDNWHLFCSGLPVIDGAEMLEQNLLGK